MFESDESNVKKTVLLLCNIEIQARTAFFNEDVNLQFMIGKQSLIGKNILLSYFIFLLIFMMTTGGIIAACNWQDTYSKTPF